MKYALLVYGEKAHADTSDAERTTFQREYLALNDAPDVHVRATTTQPVMKDTDLTGADDYMHGLKEFAQGVLPASLDVNASLGDERNALIMVTVQAALGPGGAKVALPAARLYLLDEDEKIKAEQVVFFARSGVRDARTGSRWGSSDSGGSIFRDDPLLSALQSQYAHPGSGTDGVRLPWGRGSLVGSFGWGAPLSGPGASRDGVARRPREVVLRDACETDRP